MVELIGKTEGERIFHEIKTEEQACTYLEGLVQDVGWARLEVDEARVVQVAQAKFREMLIRYGRALGALTTLMHCRVLGDVAYTEFHARIQGSVEPRAQSIVGG